MFWTEQSFNKPAKVPTLTIPLFWFSFKEIKFSLLFPLLDIMLMLLKIERKPLPTKIPKFKFLVASGLTSSILVLISVVMLGEAVAFPFSKVNLTLILFNVLSSTLPNNKPMLLKLFLNLLLITWLVFVLTPWNTISTLILLKTEPLTVLASNPKDVCIASLFDNWDV